MAGEKSKTQQKLDAIAEREKAAKATAPNNGAAVDTWLDQLALLVPIEPFAEEIAGHLLTFKCPKTAVWFRALPVFMRAWEKARELNPDRTPIGVVAGILYSWDTPQTAAAFFESICEILDIFLEKEPGWTAENLDPFSTMLAVRNFAKVIPAKGIASFFGPVVATNREMFAAILNTTLAETLMPDSISENSSPVSAESIPDATGENSQSESS